MLHAKRHSSRTRIEGSSLHKPAQHPASHQHVHQVYRAPSLGVQAEGVAHTPDGLEAVVFTADGDMRQALNNLQARQWAVLAATRACLLLPLTTSLVHAASSAHAPLTHPPASSAHLLQATSNGFGLVNAESVFRVCDQPHPKLIGAVVQHCMEARIDDAYQGMRVCGWVCGWVG